MELAGTNLLHCLSPEDDYLPLWSVTIEPDKKARRRKYWPEHNIGRWWDALLRLEAATGFAIPAQMEDAMMRHLRSCLDNPLSICVRLDKAASRFDHHSQREILLALAALARWRDNDWAIDAGHLLIESLDRFIRHDGAWDLALMNEAAAKGGRFVDVGDGSEDTKSAEDSLPGVELTASHGRMIEGLLEFYTACGDPIALLLAQRLAEFHLEASTCADGTVPKTTKYIHTHSLFGTLRGLLLFGKLTRQQEYIDRVATTYARTVRTRVKQSGFISHDWGSDQRGETTSPGDAAQLALALARLGYTEFLDDAERIVRARILPSQITAPQGLSPAPEEDPAVDFEVLTVGAFGGMHTHPHGGILPTTDITAADLHTLCDVYAHITEQRAVGLIISFHLDCDDEHVRSESIRGDRGRLTLEVKQNRGPVLVRIPSWVPRASVDLEVDGQRVGPSWVGGFLMVDVKGEQSLVELGYDLPEQEVEEETDGVTYRFTWRGDDVCGMAPNTDHLPFYPTVG